MILCFLHFFHGAIGSKPGGLICFFLMGSMYAFGNQQADTPTSSRKEATLFIEKITELKASASWPGVNPNLFLQDIKENVYNSLAFYEGTNTNFCGYAALSYLILHDDPLQYARFMVQLYNNGKAKWGNILFQPSAAIRNTAGRLKFKGGLDIRPAEQMWLLSLADHFKGYLNLFNHHYNRGDENTFWAAVNYSKFNRMVRTMSGYQVTARGSDLMKPWIHDLYSYISNSMKTGITVLYLNNLLLHKKNHNRIRTAIPTHYVILLDISKTNDGLVSITYWDYGFRTLRQLTESFLKKIIFGISHCTKKTAHDQ